MSKEQWREIQTVVGAVPDGIPGDETAAKILAKFREVGLIAVPAPTHINDAGLDIIMESEGLRLTAYQDTGGVWTIGYGHTSGVARGQVITEAQAEAFLQADVSDAETAVRKLCPITTPNQFSALVSFCYNLGAGQLKESTLRRLHNEGDYDAAANEFARWVYDDGIKLNGLVKRRAAEAALYRAP